MFLNYINQFVQLLKISNHQLSQATNTKFITQSIISNIDTGICIIDDEGKIQMINERFQGGPGYSQIPPGGYAP